MRSVFNLIDLSLIYLYLFFLIYPLILFIYH